LFNSGLSVSDEDYNNSAKTTVIVQLVWNILFVGLLPMTDWPY